MDPVDTLHVAYGDVLVVREALREGPPSPDPAERLEEFVARRAGFLAKRHDAPELSVRKALKRAWQKLDAYSGPIVLHVDEAHASTVRRLWRARAGCGDDRAWQRGRRPACSPLDSRGSGSVADALRWSPGRAWVRGCSA